MPSILLALLPLFLSPTPQSGETTIAFPELSLTIELPKLEHLVKEKSKNTNEKGQWTGKLGASDVRIRVNALSAADYNFFEPEDVVETWRDSIRDPNPSGSEAVKTEFTFQSIHCVSGEVGCEPILATVRASMQSKDDASQKGSLFLIGALVPQFGWSMRVDAWPALDAETANKLALELEKCAKYSGKPRDPRWTDEEALALWKKYAPESTFKKFEKPVRTDHFIVLTNSTSPGPFVKKLEPWYATVKKAMPCEELKGRRLLPILLMRTDDDFQNFYRTYNKLQPKDDIDEQSYSEDYWVATSCDDDDDYEHQIDLAKQFVITRLRAWNCNRWLRSGLRESAASKPKERGEALRAIKKGKFTPFMKLLDDTAWSKEDKKRTKTGTSDEADYWEQAALWMDFLRDGPWPKDSFQHFLRSVSGLADGDQVGVIAALQSVYGMDPKTLQTKWVEYYAKK